MDEKVQKFCKAISQEEPVKLPYTDVKYGYESTHCYDNVLHYVKHHGGDMVTGWIIWTYPNGENPLFDMEAEHHAVWKSKSNKLYDITPRVDGEKNIIFLPDLNRPYDPKYKWLNKNFRNFKLQSHNMIGLSSPDERIVYHFDGLHPYHEKIKNLPKNENNSIE